MAGEKWTLNAFVASALGLLPACYGGLQADANALSGGDAGGDGAGDGADDGADGGDDGADDGGGDDGPPMGQCGEAQTGPTKLRRLTNAQYRRTIRDLINIDATVVDTFPPDELVGSFKSNANAAVGEIQVEQYMDAAESIATDAVGNVAALLPCDPVAAGEDACAEEFIRTMGKRAYRRPLEEDEVSALVAVYDAGKAQQDFANGIRVALQGMLQSPYFLYHVEFGPAAGPSDEVVPVTQHELASRLSYFLWDSMPDDTLFAAADNGALATDEEIEAQVERMLDDGKAAESIANFHLQWVGIDVDHTVEKDTTVFPAFTPQLLDAMRAETADYVNWVIGDQDARLETLLTSAVAVTEDPDLLALYEITPAAGHVPGQPHALDPAQRAGLITQASLLAEHSHANQTSPIHRGQLLRENFFCMPLPPPPEDVDDVPPDPEPGATTRERFSEHSENPECAACHELIDGLGFGLEGYDGIGAFRTIEEGKPVDVSGNIAGGTDVDGPFNGGVELAQRLAASSQVQACVAKQWFVYALGRQASAEDACAFDAMETAFEASDYDIRELIKTIALSDSFRFRATGGN